VDDPSQVAADQFRSDHAGLSLGPITIVIAAFNEEESVGAVAASVPAKLGGLSTSVLVVDDGSTDRTAEAAAAAGAVVCRLPVNQGQGAALRLGYRMAVENGARFLATLDADGQWSAKDLPAVLEPVLSGHADLVSGSRRLGHADTDISLVRSTGVVVFGTLIKALTRTRVTDPANGLRAMTAEVAGSVTLEQPQFQSAELLLSAICRGFRFAEVPVGHGPRQAGRTKKGGNLFYGARFARVIAATYVRERGWRRLVGAVDSRP
jgi:catechol 2,3-dioxygenase-like lactoylglutathione lyase family enzyme